MINEVNNICICWHDKTDHGIVEVDKGGFEDLDDGEDGVAWRTHWVSVDVCGSCDKECIFEPMTNLQYMEYKYKTLTEQRKDGTLEKKH